jgi:hypothetical protein
MEASRAAALVLLVVGLACMGYGAYRVLALGQSMIPIGPVGLMFGGIGLVMLRRSDSDPSA